MNKHSASDLVQMQSLPLDAKIRMTKNRIQQWYEAFEGNVYVSFSGGKDSTVLLHIARSLYPDIEAVFVDTGLEYPEIREFVKSIDNVTWLKPEMNFKQVILKYGYPVGSKRTALNIEYGRKALERGDAAMFENYVCGKRINKTTGKEYKFMPIAKRFMKLFHSNIKVSNKCCDVMKKNPLVKYQKETKRKPILGTMAEESRQRRDGWLKTGCNSFKGKNAKSLPLSFWTEQDILQYIKKFNIPYSSAYGDIVPTEETIKLPMFNEEIDILKTTKCDRTGCMFCMFGCHLEQEPNRFQRMKETHPKQYEYILKPISEGGLGMKEVLDYIGVKY